MKRGQTAFTLIELLVVIAIIAILAAILFPVFAQAKAAAKASASLSNTKQLSIGVLMYGGDADDNLPLATTWNTGSDQLTYGAGLDFSTWAWVTQPYIKNSSVFLDPQTSPNAAVGTVPQRNIDTYYTQFGYNYTYLSPDAGATAGMGLTSTSTTSFAKVAETVMLAAKYASAENTSGNDYGTVFPGGVLSGAVVDAPACYNIPYWCMNGWGIGGMYDGDMKLSDAAGGKTGGVSLRTGNKAIVAWLDGHSKSMAPGALAIGSNWSPTAPVGVDITDVNTYLWDNQ